MRRCACGCGEPVAARHHIVYLQELRRADRVPRADNLAAWRRSLAQDSRNLIGVGWRCHLAHHARAYPYRLTMLPDSAYEFAAEVLGPAAPLYLARHYVGDDPRLDALLRATDAGRTPAT